MVLFGTWAEKGVLYSVHFQVKLREAAALCHGKLRAAFGQSVSRIILDLFMWQEFFRVKWVSERSLSQLLSWKVENFAALYEQETCGTCGCAFITLLAIIHSYRLALTLIYLSTLLKDTSWRPEMARKQAIGTALVSLNCLRSASWEAQHHQSPRPSSPGGSLWRRYSAEHWRWNSQSFILAFSAQRMNWSQRSEMQAMCLCRVSVDLDPVNVNYSSLWFVRHTIKIHSSQESWGQYLKINSVSKQSQF